MKRKTISRAIMLTLMLALASFFAVSHASTADPVFYPDNPTCQDLGLGTMFQFKVEDYQLDATSFTLPNGDTITITDDGTYFDWTSTLGIDAVISKGGNGANVYFYSPESFGDTGLHSPDNAGGDPAAISHISFCYDYELGVSKTAEPYFERTYKWDLEKSVAPEKWDLFVGDSGTSDYAVTATKSFDFDSGWNISGAVTIFNPAHVAVTVTIADQLTGGIPVTFDDCASEEVIAAGATLVCHYSVDFVDEVTSVTNNVTVTSGTAGVLGDSAKATANFVTPNVEHFDTLDVEDTNGMSWTFTDTGTETYTKTFTCGEDQEYPNTVTASYGDKDLEDSANVVVDCHELDVSKNAKTFLTRTWEWTIEKSVAPDVWDLFVGDSGTSKYTVSVDKIGFTDSEWAVLGTIIIKNDTPLDAVLNGVSDVVSPTFDADVKCYVTFPFTLLAGDELSCQYKAFLPNADIRKNTATATLQNYDYASDGSATPAGTTGFTGKAVVDFSSAIIKHVNASINVSDTNGMSWLFSDSDSVQYERTFACSEDEGKHENVATIDETGQSDDATVVVNCYALQVSKTAVPTFNRYYDWEIDKSADQTELLLSAGQLFQVNYSVKVDVASYTDKDFKVSGEITIANPAPMAADLTDVIDVISPDIAASVECPALVVPASGSLTCTYASDLPDATFRINTATATLQNYDYASDLTPSAAGTTDFSGSTAVEFPKDPAIEYDECVDVYDNKTTASDVFLGTVCAAEAPHTFTYSLWFGQHAEADVYLLCGYNESPNVARFVTNDFKNTGQDTWNVYSDVACVFGCTLTPGYWKTHSSYGPAPYDDTWASIGEDTAFFASGMSYYQILWAPPQGGNAYIILAHAYIAAELNMLNGASMPEDVMDAYDQATELFLDWSLPTFDGLKGKAAQVIRQDFLNLATILDDYNNGLLGPGHCTE